MDFLDATIVARAQGVLIARYGFDSVWANLWMLAQADDLGLTVEHVAEGVVAEVEMRARQT